MSTDNGNGGNQVEPDRIVKDMDRNMNETLESQLGTSIENDDLKEDSESSGKSHGQYSSVEEDDYSDSDEDIMGGEEMASPKNGGMSSYEKMRLERIQRNREYLATLGLDKRDQRREVKQQKKISDKWEFLQKRESIQRRSKNKEVNYTDHFPSSPRPPKKTRLSLGPEEDQDPNDRSIHKQKTSSKGVSLVIYRELKAMESKRRRDAKTAKKLLRAAEVELKYAKRQAAIYTQKQQRALWEEQMKLAAQAFHKERTKLLPMIQELDSRRGEIVQARDKLRRQLKSMTERSQARRARAFQHIKNAQMRYSALVKETKLHLANLFFESLSTTEESAITKNPSHVKTKTDNTLPLMNPKDSVIDCGIDIQQVLDQCKNDRKGSSRSVKNVWGPVTGTFANSLQTQWLENDNPVAAFSVSQYVPQVGDAVLYYPCAHREFLMQYPDSRAKKRKTRVPLWERAREELEKDDAEKRIWYTSEWISSIIDGTGRYPILCYVEETCAEFPRDPNIAPDSRRKSNSEEIKNSVLNEDHSNERKTRGFQSRPPRAPKRDGPVMGMHVILKPITGIVPPTLSSNGNFLKPTLDIPPTFSVLVFPTEKRPFLIPYSWAFRSSMCLHADDRVEWLSSTGCRSVGSVVNTEEDTRMPKIELFRNLNNIIKQGANFDLYSSQKLDEVMDKAFLDKKDGANAIPLKEVDLRHVIQLVSFQYVKSNESDCTILNGAPKTSFNDSSLRDMFDKIWIWIRYSLPHWNSIRVQWDNTEEEENVSAWDLKYSDSSKQMSDINQSTNDALVNALAPIITLVPDSSNFGGYIYHLRKPLALRIDAAIKLYIDTCSDTIPFVEPVDDNVAPGYSWYVPIGMSLRRIQRRLKMHVVRITKPFRRMFEDLNMREDDALKCSYYRSVDSLLQDVEDIYTNCLLYNAPDSDIVGLAQKVTKNLSAIIEAVRSQYTIDLLAHETTNQHELRREVDLLSKVDQELFSLASCRRSTLPMLDYSSAGAHCSKQPDGSVEMIGGRITGSDNDVIEKHIGNRNMVWLPQAGDKILYNFEKHQQFVDGHLSTMTSLHANLPSVYPNDVTPTPNNCINNFSANYWMYGTITRVRYVAVHAPYMLDYSPIFAIGIKFHYYWLRDEEKVVYWRPCCDCDDKREMADEVNGQNQEEESSTCSICHLSPFLSFLVPAWNNKSLRILPPYPANSLNMVNPPGVLERIKCSVSKSFDMLRERCVAGLRFDAIDEISEIDVFEKLMQTDRLPKHLQCIFDDENDENPAPLVTFDTEQNDAKMCLINYRPYRCDVTFTSVESSQLISSSSSGSKHLCMELIHERLRNSYYRSNYAILHDIFQSFLSFLSLILRESAGSRGLNPLSAKKIAIRLLLMFMEDLNDGTFDPNRSLSLPTAKNGDPRSLSELQDPNRRPYEYLSTSLLISQLRSTQRLLEKTLNNKETSLFNQIYHALEFHAAAVVCVLDFYSAEAALGSYDALEIPDQGDSTISESRMRALKVADDILASLAPERQVQKTPEVKIKLKIAGICHLEYIDLFDAGALSEDDEDDSSDTERAPANIVAVIEQEPMKNIDLKSPIGIFSFNTYHANEKLIQALFCSDGRRSACARCKLGYKSVLWCRATSAHMNPDFVFLEYLERIGGVSGLLNTLSSDSNAHASVELTQPVNTDGTFILQDENSLSQNIYSAVAPIPDISKPDVDYNDVLQKAEAAFEYAIKVMDYSHSLLDKELELSEDFIKDTFPVDPVDGHYEVCIKCGKGGDVLCCETCPTVCHYQCVGLKTVPEGDWTCWKCLSKDLGEANELHIETDFIRTLSEKIDYLRSLRKKDRVKNDQTKNDDTSSEESSSSESEPDDAEFEPQIGSVIMKVAKRGNVSGEIVLLPTRRSKLYRVLFADGTLEDIPENDVRKFRSNYLEDKLRKSKASKETKTSSSKRGRPPTVNEDVSIEPLPPEPWPRPGFVSTNLKFYACLANDTYAKVARKVGLRYWYQLAAVVDNHVRYGKDYHSLLLEGALVRLPKDVDENMAKSLIDPNLPIDVVKVRGNKKRASASNDRDQDTNVDEWLPPTVNEDVSIEPLPPEPWPRPGFVSTDLKFYACLAIDTYAKVARKVGLRYWYQLAAVVDNNVRYGKDYHSLLLEGALVRLPKDVDENMAKSLIDPNLPIDVVKVRGNKKRASTSNDRDQDTNVDERIQSTFTFPSINLPVVPFPPVPTPRTGLIDLKKNYYCCEENDTCLKIARKIGCNSWHDIASISENVDRYGSALQDEKTRFRKGTLIRIPLYCDRKMVLSLVDRPTRKIKKTK